MDTNAISHKKDRAARQKDGSIPEAPTPEQVRQARDAAGLSQSEAAALVYSSITTWSQYERDVRRMHPSMFELFLMKTRSVCLDKSRKEPVAA